MAKAIATLPSVPAKPEAERIHLGSFPPTVPALRSGKMELGKIMVQASAFIDTTEILWLAEVTAAGQTFEALVDSGPLRFHSLGFKLPASLSHIIRAAQNAKSLHEDLAVNEESAQLAGTVVNGRQVLFSMHGSFKTNGALNLMHRVEDLSNLQWCGG